MRRYYCFALALSLLSSAPSSRADDPSTNAVTDAWIPWGESSCVSNDDVVFSPWPEWMVSAFKIGGAWDTNHPAWVVEVGDTNEAALNIEVDRFRLTNNVLMKLDYVDHSNATLMLDLYQFTGTNDPNEPVFTSNLFNNLLSGGGGVTSRTFTIPFGLYTNAVGIRLRRDAGAMTVFDTVLSSDRDGDGYADSEEWAWGSDSDSALSVPCAAITGQVFYAGVQTGVIHVLATTNSADWASAHYLTLGISGVYTLAGLPLQQTWHPRAFRDVNGNGIADDWEPRGGYLAPTGPNSLVLTGNTGGVNITLTDPDSDGDGMSDAVERVLGLDPYTSNSFSPLPFLENFETNTVHLGDVNGQNGWIASPGNTVLVQTSVVWEGSQALSLKSTNTSANVCQLFAVSNAPVVWVDMYVQAFESAVPTNAVSGSAFMLFDGNGYLKVYDGLAASSNKWVTLTNVSPSGTTGAWVRLTTKLDYSTQRWLVCVDGILAAEGLGFATPVSQFAMVSLTGEQGVMDALAITTNQPSGLSLDGDHLPDDWEMAHFGNLDQADDGDPDQDGASNLEEYRHGTDLNLSDTDGDGLPDGWEIHNGFDPRYAGEAGLDSDGDGLTNGQEYQRGTNPKSLDTDGDGMPDKWEVDYQLNPTVNDAAQDGDADGLANLVEFQKGADPQNPDSDGDGLLDGAEVNAHRTNPTSTDSDGDGLPDAWEVANGTAPDVADAVTDTDGDGMSNMEEYLRGTPPANVTNALKRLTWSGVSTGAWTDANWLNAPPVFPGATEDAGLVSNVLLSVDGHQKVNILQVSKGEVRVSGTLAPYSVVLSNGVLSSAGTGSIESPNTNRTAGRFAFEMVAGTNSAVLQGAGTSLRKSGSGAVLVTGLNGYSGRTQLDAGVLRAQDGAGLPSGSQLYFNGGVLGATGLFSRIIGASPGMVYWAGNGGFAALGGPLSVRLNGGAAIEWNSTSGFSGKTLYLNTALADNVIELLNPILLKGNYTVQVDDNATTSNDLARMSGPIANGDATARGLGKTGAGILELAGTNTYTGPTTVSGGILRGLDGLNIPGPSALVINGGVIETRGMIGRSVVNAAGGVYWANNGGFAARGGALTLTLAGGQTLSWPALTNGFNGKTLVMGSTTADDVVELVNAVELRGDRTVQVNDNVAVAAERFRMAGSIVNGDGTSRKLTKTGTGLLELGGTNDYDGATLVTGRLRARDGVGLPANSLLQFNAGVLECNGAFNRAITNAAGGVYWLGHGGFAAQGGPLTVSLNGGAPILFGSTNDGFCGKTLFLGSVSADNRVDLVNPLLLCASRAIQVDDNGESPDDYARISGVISNGDATARALYKYGTGLLELTATNAFTGGAVVQGGALRISGVTPSLVTVYTNAVLSGCGTVKGLTINGGGTLAPGADQPGTLTSRGSVTFFANSIYRWRLAPTNSDALSVIGNVSVPGRCRLLLEDFGGCADPASRFTFLRYTGTVSCATNCVIDTSRVAGLARWNTSAVTIIHDPAGKRFYLTGLQVALSPADDQDGDGMADAWESLTGLNPADPADGTLDQDGDGLTNAEEFRWRLSPTSADSDGDGLDDRWEVTHGTEPNEPDAAGDPDHDGLSNLQESQCGSWPLLADSDGDGLTDSEEVLLALTNVGQVDSDADGIPDLVNVQLLDGTNTVRRTGQWAEQQGSLVSLSATNARLEYAVSAPRADLYRLAVDLDNRAPSAGTARVFRVQVLLDSLPCGWLGASALSNEVVRAGLILPWLPAGNHTVRLAWLDDKNTNKVLEVRQVLLQAIDGPDADGNGRQDGADALFAAGVDSDGDGLADKDELDVYGTNPLKWDTDGDTLGDGEEISVFGTNPLPASSATNGVPDAVLVEEKNGVDSAKRDVWHITCPWLELGAVLANSGTSARVSCDFSVTTAGIHRVGMQLCNVKDDPPDNYRFRVQVSVDGVSNGVATIFADMDLSGTGFVNTGWLTPGTHRVTLQWLNDASAAGRAATLGIEKVRLYAVNAPDADGNGVQDWMETALDSLTDSDGDGLSDKDEALTHHTNPLAADTDGDGLTDKEELAAGTNPNLADTDGDGVSDGQEVKEAMTDPLAAGFDGTSVDVAVVSGATTNHAAGDWRVIGSTIEARCRRGFVDYVMDCPVARMYRLRVNATHIFRTSQCSPVVPVGESDVQVYLDGHYLGKRHLVAWDGTDGQVEVFTPWLADGAHTVRIFWENVQPRLSLRIRDVRMQQLGGTDQDGNGLADWMEASLRAQSGWDTPPAASVVSPVCVEGAARFVDMMGITAGGVTGQVQHGVLGRWYADVPLSPEGITPVVVGYQAGQFARSNTIAWTALDVMSATSLVIRCGDSLKLAAGNPAMTGTVAGIEVAGVTNIETSAGMPAIVRFTAPGTYVVRGSLAGDTPCESQVTVMGGAFPSEAPACMIGATRSWACTNMADGAVLEADASVVVGWSNQVATVRMSAINDDHYLVARAYAGGPILAATRLDGFWVQGAVDSYVWVVERNDEYQVWQNTMFTKRVPASVSIQLRIFVGGVTFDDLTIERWLTAADLDEVGSYTFRMLHPNSALTSTCHTIKVYQGGVCIGEAYYGGILMPQE